MQSSFQSWKLHLNQIISKQLIALMSKDSHRLVFSIFCDEEVYSLKNILNSPEN